jgi:hypothetical protein
MAKSEITTIEELHHYLYLAMQLEHATIPPYLLALYSIKPGTNLDAYQTIRVVVVEEMLHLTLAANILNAVGGKPDLTVPGFVPLYPTGLPDGEKDFVVDLQPFSEKAVDTFLKIERPAKAPSEEKRLISTPLRGLTHLGTHHRLQNLHYYSIGEFYEEIIRGLNYLYEKEGKALFSGDKEKQCTAEYYYSGGGELFGVYDLDSARAAANLIIEQGEGLGGEIYNKENELAHFYRFEQLKLGRYYVKGDTPGNPTGPELKVDWDAVYPFKVNPCLDDYPQPSELYDAAVAFNETYAEFLSMLTRAYNGEPKLLLEQAVPKMFDLRNLINQLIHNPIPPKDGVHAAPTAVYAAPTFQIVSVPAEVLA